MLVCVQRASDHTRQLLATAGRDQAGPENLDLNREIELLRHGFPAALPMAPAIEFDLQPGLPKVSVPSQHLQRVVRALVSNACEAIGDREGQITTTSGQADLDAEDAAWLSSEEEPAPGTYVTLEIRDTGAGLMPPS